MKASTSHHSQHALASPTQALEGKEESSSFLHSLLDKNLRVTTTDSRMFWGAFKCTDPESNLVLQHTYEYRQPTPKQVAGFVPHVTIVSPSLESMGLGEDDNHDITRSLQSLTPQSTQADASVSASGNGKAKTKGKDKATPEKVQQDSESDKVTLEMTSRYLGLVVIPGEYVAKIEAEEFASQMRGRKVTVVPPTAGSA